MSALPYRHAVYSGHEMVDRILVSKKKKKLRKSYSAEMREVVQPARQFLMWEKLDIKTQLGFVALIIHHQKSQ